MEKIVTTNNFDKPFIKKFTDGGFFYVYDVNTLQIVEVEKPVFDVIDDYEDGQTPTTQSFEEIKNAAAEHGLFSYSRPKKVFMGVRSAEDVITLHKKGLHQIILEISKTCNLVCAYCRASGKYADPHPPVESMSKETCFKAIDFFCQRTVGNEKHAVTFYGGEPLLRFDLIEEATAYVKKHYGADSYAFNLTTNGTLLSKEKIDFFIENDFHLLVSLDGPIETHDKYRTFKNGKGSFRRIMENLEFLKTYNKDYFTRQVSISSVMAPPFDNIDGILDFFSNDKTLHEIRSNTRSSLVDTRETSFISDFGLKESIKEYRHVAAKLLGRLKKSILDNDLSRLTIEKQRYYQLFYNLARRPVERLLEYVHPFGSCHIGLRRLFVDASGDFYVCERVDKSYKIGDIDSGFDYERIAYFYRKLEEALEECRNCWAISHCERCWAAIGNIEEFTGKKKEEFCYYSKALIENAFKIYTQLLREDPNSLKVFKNVTVG